MLGLRSSRWVEEKRQLLAGERVFALTFPGERAVGGPGALASTFPFCSLELAGTSKERPRILRRLNGVIFHCCATLRAVFTLVPIIIVSE